MTDDDLTVRFLGCGDGPASFNAEATMAGVEVVSVDPIYAFSAEEIGARVEAVFDDMIGQTTANTVDFTWGRGVDDLDDLATSGVRPWRDSWPDYEVGRIEGRYRVGELPRLPFTDGAFDVALCSHFLFLYGEQLSTEFHVESLAELCRVASEVRVFPLLELGRLPSRHLEPVRSQLDAVGIDTRIVTVEYEFQRGGKTGIGACEEPVAKRTFKGDGHIDVVEREVACDSPRNWCPGHDCDRLGCLLELDLIRIRPTSRDGRPGDQAQEP